MHAALMARLRTVPGITLHEDLNLHTALIRNGQVYAGDTCLNDLDAYFWYCEVDRAAGSFDLEVLKTLARSTKVVRDPHRFETALDKYTAHLCLRDAGLNVPEFVLFDHRYPQKMADIMDEWGAAMLKPRRGGWGKGVTLIDSASSLRDTIGYIRSTAGSSPDQGFFLERYYDNDLDRWASISMLNGEILYGYRKLAAKIYDLGAGRKKVFDEDEKGGGVTLADLTPAHEAAAHKACEALGLGWIGFDMIWVDGQPMIIDENTSPGNYAELYAAVGKDPAQLWCDWIVAS